MREIQLTKGYVALVDDEDYESVSTYKWHAAVRTRADGSVRVYAIGKIEKPSGDWVVQLLHRFIKNVPTGLQVDHINGNALDNRHENLRICTNTENSRNRHSQIRGASKFKGVVWDKQHSKWRAQIKVDLKCKYLGLFEIESDAALAYNAAAFLLHGEFASINVF